MATDADSRKILQELVAQGPGGWDKAWEEKVTPWDIGIVQPPLRDFIQSGEFDLPRKGRALVPGCGRGYDAIFIASSLGLDTLAIDISPLAIDAANQLLKSPSDAPLGMVSFQEADFFALTVPQHERFDLIYDHTFFVAIPPSMRNDWGHKITELIKPGGYLVALIFPLDSPSDRGPPFFVQLEHYLEVLGQGWEMIVDEVPKTSYKTHVGRERLVVWKRA